jgi:hypothetical protein
LWKPRVSNRNSQPVRGAEAPLLHRISSGAGFLRADQLASAYGLGGRARTMADPVERIRKAVTNRIRDSLDRIAAEHEALGRHLANAVHTGARSAPTPPNDQPPGSSDRPV